MVWILAALALLAAVGFLFWRGAQRERLRRAVAARREEERDRARQVLAGPLHPLPEPGIPLQPGERAYYRTVASPLEPEPDGGFRRRGYGELWVTDRAVVYRSRGGELVRTPIQEVERVDIPYLDVIALVTFRDTVTRDEVRAYYQVPEPLVLAAHVARWAGFELILE